MIDNDVTMLVTLFTRDYNESFTLDTNTVFREMLLNIFLTSLIVAYALSFIIFPINQIITVATRNKVKLQ